MCYDTSTFFAQGFELFTRCTHADGWCQSQQPGPGCNQRLDSGRTESLNRMTCKLYEDWERHRSVIIHNRRVCCSYSSCHPVPPIEQVGGVEKSNKKETRSEGEQKEDELTEESSERRLELLMLRPAGSDCETNTLRTATEGGEERGSRETEEAISGFRMTPFHDLKSELRIERANFAPLPHWLINCWRPTRSN